MSCLDFRTIATTKAQARGDLLRSVAGMAPDPARQEEPEPEKPRRTSLDGGARQRGGRASSPYVWRRASTALDALTTGRAPYVHRGAPAALT